MDSLEIIIGLCVVLVLVYYFGYHMRFKHKVLIRDVVNGRQLVRLIKAAEVKTNENMYFWILQERLFKHRRVSAPPNAAVEIQDKGKKFAEIIKSGESYEWLSVNIDDKKAFANSLNTNDRFATLLEIRKAHEHKKKTTQEMIMLLAPWGAIAVIVVCIIVFFGELSQPALQMADKNQAYNAEITKQLEILQRMDAKIQTLVPDQQTNAGQKEAPN